MYEKKYECSIENYICDNYSICREERQYAVFLYNILKYYGKPERRANKDNVKKIFKACGLGDTEKITQVFYEATFMRDFFERNRRLVLGKDHDNLMLQATFSPSSCKIDDPDPEKSNSFNHNLVKYVYDYYKEETSSNIAVPYPDNEHHLGHLKLNSKEKEKYERFSTIKYMMNAKPDIAIVYENAKQESFLLFLECKFGSGIDTYDNGQTQLQIQWLIAKFLCKYYLKEINVDHKMEENKESHLVQFVRKSKEDKSDMNKPKIILIDDLISLNNDILG